MTKRYCALGLLVLVIAGAAMRAPATFERPLWFDEADTWRSAVASEGVTYAKFFNWTNHFENAPLGYMLSRIAVDILGTEAPWALRLPALIFGILCIPAAYLLGYVVRDHLLGVLTALLVTVDPTQFDQSQQARMYPMLLLFTILAAVFAIRLLRNPARSHLDWIGLGIMMGLCLWSTLLGAMTWVSIAIAGSLIVAGSLLTRRTDYKASLIIVRLTAAYFVAIALVNIGIYSIIWRLLYGPDRGGRDMPIPAIAREVVVGIKDMIWPTSGQDAQLVIALLLTAIIISAAGAGLFVLSRRCKTSTLVMVGLILGVLIMMVPFRRAHRFMDPRYFTVLQPALWIGLACIGSLWHRPIKGDQAHSPALEPLPRWRLLGLALVLAYAAMGVWQCLHIERFWQQPDKYLLAPLIASVGERMAPNEALALDPPVTDILARYYKVPVDPRLDEALHEKNLQKAQPSIPADFDAPAAWLVVGMVNDQRRLNPDDFRYVRKPIEALAAHYGQTIDDTQYQRHIGRDRVTAIRFSAQGVQWESQTPGLQHPRPATTRPIIRSRAIDHAQHPQRHLRRLELVRAHAFALTSTLAKHHGYLDDAHPQLQRLDVHVRRKMIAPHRQLR